MCAVCAQRSCTSHAHIMSCPWDFSDLLARVTRTCPISFDVIVEPVRLVGELAVYERDAIRTWVESHRTSPMTRKSVSLADIEPDSTTLPARSWECKICSGHHSAPSVPDVDETCACGALASTEVSMTIDTWEGSGCFVEALLVRHSLLEGDWYFAILATNQSSTPKRVTVAFSIGLLVGANVCLPERMDLALPADTSKIVYRSRKVIPMRPVSLQRGLMMSIVSVSTGRDTFKDSVRLLNVAPIYPYMVGDCVTCLKDVLPEFGVPARIVDIDKDDEGWLYSVMLLSSRRTVSGLRIEHMSSDVIARRTCRVTKKSVGFIVGIVLDKGDVKVSLRDGSIRTPYIARRHLVLLDADEHFNPTCPWKYDDLFGISSSLPVQTACYSPVFWGHAQTLCSWLPSVLHCLSAWGFNLVLEDSLSRRILLEESETPFLEVMSLVLTSIGLSESVVVREWNGDFDGDFDGNNVLALVPKSYNIFHYCMWYGKHICVAVVLSDKTVWRRIDDDFVCCERDGISLDTPYRLSMGCSVVAVLYRTAS